MQEERRRLEKENEEKREEGEHFYTLNWYDDTVVGLD